MYTTQEMIIKRCTHVGVVMTRLIFTWSTHTHT